MPLTNIPALGLGTWQLEGDLAAEAVRDALAIGYRHVDTARMYGNEREVGEGLRAAGVERDEVWVTTKVWRDDLEPDRLRRSAEASLRDLGLERVDLLLVHWPNAAVPLGDTLAALHRARQDGLTRHIGVANFPSALLREAVAQFPIFCDQVEYHPFLEQSRLLELARENDVLITAYSPLAHGKVPDDETLKRIGDRYDKSAGQVALRWLLDQPGVSPIPKASSQGRRQENFDVFDFTLSDEDREEIAGLPKDVRTANPPWAPDWDA
jgi:2,5-diketo-D-gluconate reductase B